MVEDLNEDLEDFNQDPQVLNQDLDNVNEEKGEETPADFEEEIPTDIEGVADEYWSRIVVTPVMP